MSPPQPNNNWRQATRSFSRPWRVMIFGMIYGCSIYDTVALCYWGSSTALLGVVAQCYYGPRDFGPLADRLSTSCRHFVNAAKCSSAHEGVNTCSYLMVSMCGGLRGSLRISPDQRSSATRMPWQGCRLDFVRAVISPRQFGYPHPCLHIIISGNDRHFPRHFPRQFFGIIRNSETEQHHAHALYCAVRRFRRAGGD